MTEAMLERKDSAINYDACRMPFRSILKPREAERHKTIVRMLKAWGVSPSRKKLPALHRKIKVRRYAVQWYQPAQTHTDALWHFVEAYKAERRASLEAELQSLFNELTALKGFEDVDDEYMFKPTARAFIRTKLAIASIFDLMGERFPRPQFASDGEGGIVTDWLHDERQVRLRFKAIEGSRDYIYYQSNDEYDVEKVSSENLRKR